MHNFNHLYYFYLIVKLDGVTKAANHLNTSQSSLSAQIKQLEENLGKKLFVKSGRKLALTSEGLAVYSYCKMSFEIFQDMTLQLNSRSPVGIKKLRIGVSDEIERPFISSVIGSLIKRDLKNNFQIHLHSGRHEEIKEKFIVKDIDLAITSDPIIASNIKHHGSILLPVSFLINPKKYHPKDRKHNTLKEYFKHGDLDLALPSSSLKLRKEIDNYLAKNKLSKNVAFESNIISTLIRSISDGAACGFIPTVYAENELKQGRVVQVGEDPNLWEHKLYMYSYNEKFFIDVKNEMERLSSAEFTY